MRKLIWMIVLICSISINVSCGYNNGDENILSNPLQKKIKWILPADTQYILESEERVVEKEINEYLKKKNVELDLCFLDQEHYVDEAMEQIQTGQDWDMIFLNEELNQYMRRYTKKYFATLTAILQNKQKKLYDRIPEYAWDIMTVNKEIYAIPNKHCWSVTEGYYGRKKLLNKHDMEILTSSICSFNKMTECLQKTVYQENCLGTYVPEQRWENELISNRFYFSGNLSTLGVIKETHRGYVVENMFETKEFQAYCNRMRKWQEDNLIREDSAIHDADQDKVWQEVKQGEYVFLPSSNLNPNAIWCLHEVYGESDTFFPVKTSDVTVSPNKIAEYSTAFRKNSENFSQAVSVFEEISTNSELYNLLLYGVEGIHYEKDGETQIRKKVESGYGSDDHGAMESHVLGNQYLSYTLEGEPINKWEELEQWEKHAQISELLGFFFRTSKVEDEIQNVASIIASDLRLLETGSVEVEKFLPKFQQKLKEAGSDRIINEYQKQLERWLKSKNEQ